MGLLRCEMLGVGRMTKRRSGRNNGRNVIHQNSQISQESRSFE